MTGRHLEQMQDPPAGSRGLVLLISSRPPHSCKMTSAPAIILFQGKIKSKGEGEKRLPVKVASFP